MSDEIDFSGMSDREILMYLAKTVPQRLSDHGKRLRALETFRNVASGAGTLLGALWIKTAVKIGITQP